MISHIHKSTITELFPSNFKIMPQTFDVFELDFALKEYHCLKTTNEFVQRSAYFEEVDGYKTNHYLLCMSKNSKIFEKKSLSTRSFFEANMFSSNYATHGFFPYRGKFHPQMIKAIMNIIGLKKGDTVLDPMCGSGTTNVEAALIGINSIGVDISPFCKLMASVKHQCLYVNLLHLENLINYQKNIVEFYSNSENYLKDIDYFKKQDFAKVVEVEDEQHYYLLRDLLLLIYLDAMGYERRRTNKTIDDVFDDVLKKYILTYADFTKCKKQLNLEIGTSEIYCGTSTSLPIEDNSIDGIITSPPYSFAIDYADNDKPQLEYMGINPDTLKQSMVGLRGNSKKEKIQLYFEDMNKSIAEMSRVLKPGKYCVIIIGSNEIQTGGIRHEVEMKKFAALNGMFLECEIVKPIKGIQNTMKEEFILFFKKGK